MESIEKLRTVARNMAKGMNLENHEECNLLLIIADEIEREIAEKYIELPVDADGVPICVGEDVVRTNDRLQPEVVRVIGVSGGSVFFKHDGRIKQNVAHNLHHAKPVTAKSMVLDVVSAFMGINAEQLNPDSESIAKCAKMLEEWKVER